MPATTRPLFEQIDTWLQGIDSTKTAAAKPTKTGLRKQAIGAALGETSHPSESVDNNTQDADTGERYRENAEDVKKDVPGQSVDETDPKSGGDQDDHQFHIGMNPKATGEDSTHETSSVKGDKEDGTTTHPADADDIGEKYSSMKLPALLKTAEDQAHSLLADIANGVLPGQTPVRTPAVTKTAAAPAQQPVAAATAGYDVAANLGMAKEASEKLASEFIEQAIRDADLDADLVGSFMHSYHQARIKKAEGEEGGEEAPPEDIPPEAAAAMAGGDPAAGGGMPPEAGGMPPEAGGGEGGGDLLSALGGGGGDPAAGGMPPEAGMGGPEGGGGGDQAAALQELAMALQELGINPEELAQLAQGQGAKMAAAVKSFQRSGKFRFSEAKTAAQARAREEIKDYIRELTGSK